LLTLLQSFLKISFNLQTSSQTCAPLVNCRESSLSFSWTTLSVADPATLYWYPVSGVDNTRVHITRSNSPDLNLVVPIRECAEFIVECLVCQLLSGHVPVCLADNCCVVSDSTRCSLQSADVPTCIVPRTYSSYVDKTFAAARPRLWISHVQLHNPDITYELFSRQLKEHLFWQSMNTAQCDLDMWRLRKAL